MYYNKLVLNDGKVLYDNIISASLSTSCNSDEDIVPGSVCSNSVEVEFWKRSSDDFSITQGTSFTYYKVDDAGKETKIGVFTCEKPEDDGQNKYKVTAYDNVTFLDKDVSDWVNNKVSFPISVSEFALALAKECGISVANNVPVNGYYKIQKFTASNVTGRELMKYVCQAGGCYGFADENGNLKFGWFSENKDAMIAPSHELPVYKLLFDSENVPLYDSNNVRISGGKSVPEKFSYYSGSLVYSDYTVKPIDKVQIKQSENDVGVIYPAGESKENAIVISGNILLSANSDSQIRPVAQELYEHLKNISYVPCSKISIPETLYVKCGDILTVTDGRKTFKTWVTNVSYSGGKCEISSVGNATRTGTSAVNNAKFNVKQKLLEISATIDGLDIKSSELGEKYSELKLSYDGLSSTTSDLKNNYTQLSQSIDGLNLSVVKNGEVRTKFAADSSSVTINSGLISFASNTISISSTNFNLSQEGNVVATGTFSSVDGTLKSSVLQGGFFSYVNGQICSAIYGYTENRQAMGSVRCYGVTNSGGRHEFAVIRAGLDGGQFALTDANGEQNVQITGGVIIARGLGISGEKNRLVSTSFGTIKMHALESPQPSFQDFGTGKCDETGICVLSLDPRFLETVSKNRSPIWNVTPTSPGEIWVENGMYAVVHGTPGQTFNWFVTSAQIGYEEEYADLWNGFQNETEDFSSIISDDIPSK